MRGGGDVASRGKCAPHILPRPLRLLCCCSGFSFSSSIDWAAHLFGLFGGVFLAMWLFAAPLRHPAVRNCVAWGGLGTYLGLLALALGVLYGTVKPPLYLLDYCEIMKVRGRL